jgi:hypothetical protein
LFKEDTKVCEFCVVSDEDVCVPGISSFAVAFCEVVDCAFGRIGTFGVTGTTGTTGLVAVRVWVEEEAAREKEGRTVVDDGVGGCVDSVSEGTSDVADVSRSEGAATMEL